ncbi:hypothetical protein [Cytobacillus purgationiresistens]|uniref:Uncharacterized protein n=1 Tax=Cytobacillus purgationiresistens TaxID=863449 RepID=A0ABU0AD95_9BACI|nr:hypothetical protein [Cytobacillus purgationiresistens]MDQ0268701.1 hypothetical protein [Cytobacillus purgationiresistens]
MFYNGPVTHIQYQHYAERSIGNKYDPFSLSPINRITVNPQKLDQQHGTSQKYHKTPIHVQQEEKLHKTDEAIYKEIVGKGYFFEAYV